MGRGYRRYTDKERADSVVFLESLGYPDRVGALDEAAKHLKINRTTLQTWFHRTHNPPEELREESRKELRQAFEDELQHIFQEMKAKRQDATYRDLGVVAGIVFDKLQLITGQPTEHSRVSGDPDNPIEIVPVNYRNAITSLAPRSMEDSDASG